MRKMYALFIGAALFSIMFPGCTPSIYKKDAAPDANFEDVLYNIPAHLGEDVVWGGVITSVVKLPVGYEIIFKQIQLDKQGIPRDGKYSAGRFIVRTSIQPDPELYKNGKTFIIAGNVLGSSTRPLGENGQYTYPLIEFTRGYPYDRHNDSPPGRCWKGMGWDGPYRSRCGGD